MYTIKQVIDAAIAANIKSDDIDELEKHLLLTHDEAELDAAGEKKLLAEIRNAFGDYVRSEGCSCCQDTPNHKKAAERLANLLKVKKYSDGSGFDFYHYATKR